MRTPNGLPAKAIPVKISVSHTNEKSVTVNTDDEGVAYSVFNVEQTPQSISVEVSILKKTPVAELLYCRHSVNLFSLYSCTILV